MTHKARQRKKLFDEYEKQRNEQRERFLHHAKKTREYNKFKKSKKIN